MSVLQAPAPGRLSESTITWLLRGGVFIAFAAFWQVAAARSSSPALATFTETAEALWYLTITSGDVWEPLLISNQSMVMGYAAGVAVAVPWGLAAGRYKLIDRASNPYIAIFLAMPMAPLIPIMILALGLTLTASVVIVFFFVFVFVVVNTRAGVRQVDNSLVEMAVSYGANERKVWSLVVLPSAMPAIFAGLRIGLGRAISGMVIAELLLVARGIGGQVLAYSGRLQGPLLFGVVTVVVLEALILLTIMRMVERRMSPWVEDASR